MERENDFRQPGAHDIVVLPDRFAISRANPDTAIPAMPSSGAFISISRSSEELSVVAEEHVTLDGFERRAGWRGLKVSGPLDFTEVGVLAGLTGCLAAVCVSVFVVSTYDTDYLFVKEDDLARALDALAGDGYRVMGLPTTARKTARRSSA